MSKLIKTIEIPEYVNISMPPLVEKIDLYNDHINSGGSREVYFDNYLMPSLVVMDFNKPVAKIRLLTSDNTSAKYDYELHFCAKDGKKDEARKFAFDVYSEIQKIFDKIK